jgi:NAD(P)-dependent dehydrogenase (short-subunit alcohol dehydrogenase family)
VKNAHQWTLDDIPDLTGKRALVTGVTSGLGEHTVLEMARKGASVVMAARSETKLRGAVDDVKRVLPNAQLIPLVMDLADLGSVRRAVDEVKGLGPLDILINNAGVMATPYHRTVDGFELQFGTNHLGHFALTGQLFPQLAAAESARVVTVASQAHRYVRSVPLTDPRTGNGHYRKWIAYGQSKLANLLFAFELDRRARAAGTAVRSMAAPLRGVLLRSGSKEASDSPGQQRGKRPADPKRGCHADIQQQPYTASDQAPFNSWLHCSSPIKVIRVWCLVFSC